MTFVENIAKRTAQPIGRTTYGRLFLAFGLFLSAVLAFGFIADEVLEGDTQGVDSNILQLIHLIANPTLTGIMQTATLFGGLTMTAMLSFALIVFLLQERRRRAVVFTIFAMGGTLVTFTLLKILFERQRPFLYNFIVESTYSFPSGHASLSSALALTVIVLTWHTRWRWYIVGVGIFYVLLIGFSRLYLGVHYPTDIVAGWLVAASWVIVVATIVGAVNWRRFKR